VARYYGVPYVIRPAGTLDRWGREQRRRVGKALSVRLLEGRLLSRAAGVHFTSESELKQAAELGFSLKATVIPLAVNTATVDHFTTCSDTPASLKTLTGQQFILFLSRIDPKKQLELLLDSLCSITKQHPGTLLAVAGDGDESYIATLKARAHSLGVADKVRWLGFVTGSTKQWLLRHAVGLVLPSASENFGIVVTEAMAAGLPVVVSENVATSELVSRARAGLVFDGSKGHLALTVATLLENPNERARMSIAGRQIVQDELTPACIGQRLEDWYRSILQPRTPKPGS
jgi:glycosyltransferase involved in cell wall biosynthesis